MKIKKFRSKTVQEGKERILSELGPEAVILSTRVIPPIPPENEEVVELVVAIDTEDQDSSILQNNLQPNINERLTKSESLEFASNIYKELSYIKNFLLELSDKISFRFISNLPNELAELAKLMVKNGYSQDFALSFVQHFKVKKFDSFEELRNEAKSILAEKLNYVSEFPKKEGQNLILFVGPTGTGKTLNIIKLGLLYKILLNAKVAVISMDTRKIGGWEQTQMLSAISNIYCTFANSIEEMKEQISLLKNYDFILVDTSGGSPRDENFLAEIEQISSSINWTGIVLVLSATQDKINFSLNLNAFNKSKPNLLMLTKLDETISIGHIYEPLLKVSVEMPLLYVSTGIDIPNSIEPATASFLTNYMFNYFD
ncbi:MAG: Flagellar biosynthesis protein FlhF [Candidatus Kapaibacterium sp.]|nr:MAG: Flagellar biosynthesis protein FlhF [Candidatus Kapabacteria bacterium]